MKNSQTPVAKNHEIFGNFLFIQLCALKYTSNPLPPFSMLFGHGNWTLGFLQHWKPGVGGYWLSTYMKNNNNERKKRQNLMFFGHGCLERFFFRLSSMSYIFALNFYICYIKFPCHLSCKIPDFQLFHLNIVVTSLILWKNVIFSVFMHLNRLENTEKLQLWRYVTQPKHYENCLNLDIIFEYITLNIYSQKNLW